jgi:hypothetical protein
MSAHYDQVYLISFGKGKNLLEWDIAFYCSSDRNTFKNRALGKFPELGFSVCKSFLGSTGNIVMEIVAIFRSGTKLLF